MAVHVLQFGRLAIVRELARIRIEEQLVRVEAVPLGVDVAGEPGEAVARKSKRGASNGRLANAFRERAYN
jgi:hypothetical protein